MDLIPSSWLPHSPLAAGMAVCEVTPEAMAAWLRSGEIRRAFGEKAADGSLADAQTFRQWYETDGTFRYKSTTQDDSGHGTSLPLAR